MRSTLQLLMKICINFGTLDHIMIYNKIYKHLNDKYNLFVQNCIETQAKLWQAQILYYLTS